MDKTNRFFLDQPVPEFVPQNVLDCAKKPIFLKMGPKDEVETAMTKLILNPNMSTVWSELERERREKYRKSGDRLHRPMVPETVGSLVKLKQSLNEMKVRAHFFGNQPRYDAIQGLEAIAETMSETLSVTEEQLKDWAAATLFTLAVSTYIRKSETHTYLELDRHLAELDRSGQDIRASIIRSWRAAPEASFLLRVRQTKNPRIEAFVGYMAFFMKESFGFEGYGILSTLVNVLFDNPLTARGSEWGKDTVHGVLRRSRKENRGR